MLEQEIDLIIARLTERTIGAHAHYTVGQTLAADIPAGVKSYFRAEVMRWLQQDLEPSLHFARVNMSTPRVRGARETFLQACTSEYLFSRSEFLGTLDNAVHFLANFLCRPQWTLTEFVFDKTQTVVCEVLLTKLEYLSDYPYYKTLINGILHRKGWPEVHKGQFQSLLNKIDRHYMRQHTGRELAELTTPIFQFLALTDISLPQRIPLKPVLAFFSDKSELRLKDYIENICHVRNATDISQEELRDILGDVPPQVSPEDEPIAAAPSMSPDEDAEHSRNPQDTTPPIVDHAQDIADEGKGIQGVMEAVSPVTPKINRNLALSLTFAGLKDSPQAHALPLLHNLISPELRELFIRELFGSDAAYYNAIIVALDATQHWKEASLYLNNFYDINHLDPQADEVVQFTELVHQRYATEPSIHP